ncbi:MAG: acyl-CoA dehydrogenase family protein [Pseudomonadota bacterium]
MSFFAKLRVAEELARACMAFAFSLVNIHNCACGFRSRRIRASRALSAGADAGERLGASALTEPGAGSDFSAITTVARKVEGGWLLTGEKAWITNAAHGDLFVTYAQTDPAARAKGIGCFLVDGTRPGFARVAPFQLMGGHAIGAAGFGWSIISRLTATSYPAGSAFKAALGGINGARAYVAAMCCGMLEEALGCAVRYGVARRAFGSPVIDHQGIRWKLAKAPTISRRRGCSPIAPRRSSDDKGDALLRRQPRQEIRVRHDRRAAVGLHAGDGRGRLARRLSDRPAYCARPHRQLCRRLDRNPERAHRRDVAGAVRGVEFRRSDRHCERSEAIQSVGPLDCFVAFAPRNDGESDRGLPNDKSA